MPFKIKYFEDDFIDLNYQKALDELNVFFGFGWIHNTPKIFIIDNRKQFDQILGYKTESWLVGYASNRLVYLLNRKNFKTESNHKYSDKKYIALLKHELCHLFFNKISKETHKPKWLNEGISLFLSGQNKLKKNIPIEFKNFFKFYGKDTDNKDNVYQESGFVVETLINKFGKEKILELIKSCSIANTEEKFEKSFNKIYGFDLNYANINKIYKKQNEKI